MTLTEQAIQNIQKELMPYLSKVKIPGNPETGQLDLQFIAQLVHQVSVLDITIKMMEIKFGATLSFMLEQPVPNVFNRPTEHEQYLLKLDEYVAHTMKEFGDGVLAAYRKVESKLVLPVGTRPKVDLSQIKLG